MTILKSRSDCTKTTTARKIFVEGEDFTGALSFLAPYEDISVQEAFELMDLSFTPSIPELDEVPLNTAHRETITGNPHYVTQSEVGLSEVPNLDTTDAVANEHSHTNKTELDKVTDGDHDVRTDNPHTVTATQVGLGNCDNTSDADKPVSTATTSAIAAAIDAVTPKTYVFYDSTARDFTTTFANGFYIPLADIITIRDGFDVEVDVEVPMRNDDASSWGGGYLEIQLNIDEGGWISTGHTGYSNVMDNNSAQIDRAFKKLFLERGEYGIPASGDFTIRVLLRHRSYTSTLKVNYKNGVGGDRYYTQLVVQENNSITIMS